MGIGALYNFDAPLPPLRTTHFALRTSQKSRVKTPTTSDTPIGKGKFPSEPGRAS